MINTYLLDLATVLSCADAHIDSACKCSFIGEQGWKTDAPYFIDVQTKICLR